MSTYSIYVRVIALSLGVPLTALLGCEAVLGIGNDKSLRESPDASVPDSRAPIDPPDAIADAAIDAVSSACTSTSIPPRPMPGNEGDAASDRTLTFAFQSVNFEDQVSAPNQNVGLNLDGVCTCPGPESCRPRKSDGSHCDLDGAIGSDGIPTSGIDNGGMALFHLYSSIHDTPLDTLVNDQIAQGAFSILIRIEHYNGLADDSQVSFSFFTASGTPRNDAGDRTVPAFDGRDIWEIDPTSSLSVDGGASGDNAIPKYKVDDAYVVNHTLVAQLGDFPIPFGAGAGIGVGLRFNMKLSGVFVTASLVPGDDSGIGNTLDFSMKNGVLAGRWSTQSILFALGSLPDQVIGGKVCDNPDSYNALRTLVCNAADISSDPAHDRGNPAYECNAVSVAMRFDGTAAHLGAFGDAADPGSPCDHTEAGQADDCQ